MSEPTRYCDNCGVELSDNSVIVSGEYVLCPACDEETATGDDDDGEDEAVLAARAAGNDPFAGFSEDELNQVWDELDAKLGTRE